MIESWLRHGSIIITYPYSYRITALRCRAPLPVQFNGNQCIVILARINWNTTIRGTWMADSDCTRIVLTVQVFQ